MACDSVQSRESRCLEKTENNNKNNPKYVCVLVGYFSLSFIINIECKICFLLLVVDLMHFCTDKRPQPVIFWDPAGCRLYQHEGIYVKSLYCQSRKTQERILYPDAKCASGYKAIHVQIHELICSYAANQLPGFYVSQWPSLSRKDGMHWEWNCSYPKRTEVFYVSRESDIVPVDAFIRCLTHKQHLDYLDVFFNSLIYMGLSWMYDKFRALQWTKIIFHLRMCSVLTCLNDCRRVADQKCLQFAWRQDLFALSEVCFYGVTL